MAVIDDIQNWIYLILFWGTLALEVWAAIDCATRKTAAFPAAGKLTKPAWLVFTILSAGLSYLIGPGIGLLSMVFLIVSLVYLADVRPAVREISGGNRW